MSCFVLYIEHAERKVIRELGVFIDGNAQGYSFSPTKNTKAQSK